MVVRSNGVEINELVGFADLFDYIVVINSRNYIFPVSAYNGKINSKNVYYVSDNCSGVGYAA